MSMISPFITDERTEEGFYRTKAGLDQAIARGLAYAPYADLIWCETSEPNLKKLVGLQKQFMKNILAKCLLITAHLHLTGKKI